MERNGDWCIGGWDHAFEIDTAALVILGWESDTRRPILATRIFTPPVDQADVVRGLVELQKTFHPTGWAYDPNAGARQMAHMLEAGEHPLPGRR